MLDIPKLPDDIFGLIRKRTPMRTATATATATATTTTTTNKELDKITSLCE